MSVKCSSLLCPYAEVQIRVCSLLAFTDPEELNCARISDTTTDFGVHVGVHGWDVRAILGNRISVAVHALT